MLIRVEPHFASINNRRKNLEVAVTVFLRNIANVAQRQSTSFPNWGSRFRNSLFAQKRCYIPMGYVTNLEGQETVS